MSGGGLTELLARLRQAASAGDGLHTASPATLALLLGLDSLTLSMASAPDGLELLWADPADKLGRTMEDLQYTLGEGPTVEAARTGRTVSVPDVSAASARWVALGSDTAHTAARAAIATPLRCGPLTAGVLTGYHTTPTSFSPEWTHGFHAVARVALRLLVQTPPNSMDALAPRPSPVDLHRAEVHQAIGFLSVQLRVPVEEAMLRLRTHAWRHGRPLREVADDILTGRLSLHPN